MKTIEFMTIGAMFCLANSMVAQVNNTTININKDSASNQQVTPPPQQPAAVTTPVVVPIVTPAPAPAQVVQSTDENKEPTFHGGEFGIRYMPTFSVLRLTNASGGEVKGDFVMGNGFGAYLGVNSKHVGLQLEAIYSATAQKYSDNGREHQINFKYVNIPLLLTLNTDKSKPVNLNVAFGPQLGVNVGTSVHTTGTSNETTVVEPVVAVKKADFGLAYGAGLEFALNPPRTVRLNLGFRGVYGLIDIRDNSKTITTDQYYVLARTHTQTYAGYIGLAFMF
jgi:opacity protein-like surface antigen